MSLPLPQQQSSNTSHSDNETPQTIKVDTSGANESAGGASVVTITDVNNNNNTNSSTGVESSGWCVSMSSMQATMHEFVDGIINPQQPEPSQYHNKFLVWLDAYFHITTTTTLKSSISTEIIGGVTSFLTIAYILSANPAILSGGAGMDENAVFFATALLSGLANIFVGFFGKIPIVIAPGMGLNDVFAYTICATLGYKWQTALGLVFVSGIIYFLLVLLAVRQKVILALHEWYRIGLAVGIGLFLALLGAADMRLVAANKNTFLTMAPLSWRMGLGLLSLLLIAGLMLRGVRWSYIVAIVATSVMSVVLRAIFERDELTISKFGEFNQLHKVAFQLNFDFDHRAIYLIIVIVLTHLFDAVGTTLVILRQAYLENSLIVLNGDKLEQSLAVSKRVRTILLVDAVFFIASGLLGSSPTTPFIESATGVSVGAKTGLASVVCGILFLVSIFIGPFIKFIAPEATGPALIMTSLLLIPFLRRLNFEKFEQVLPALLTMIMIPFTYSIGHGAALGYAFILFWVVAGKARKITPVMAVLILLSVVHILVNLFIQLHV